MAASAQMTKEINGTRSAAPGPRERPAAPDQQVRHDEGQQRPAPGQGGPLGLQPGVPGRIRPHRATRIRTANTSAAAATPMVITSITPENGNSRLFRMAASMSPHRR